MLIDLLIAALGAIGANGLGAALLAYGGHAPPARRTRVVDAEARMIVAPTAAISADQPIETIADEPVAPIKVDPAAPIEDEHDHVKEFAMSRLTPEENAALTFEKMVEVYQGWCCAKNVETLPLDRAAELFAELVNHLELKVEHRDGDPVIIGLSVQEPMKLIEVAA